jgi:serine/threonine-protein kinase ATR
MQPHIFLRSHVLGVVSYLNSELLDVHGKRPLEVKRKVLKGINEMIHIIGDAIAVASPQVSNIHHTFSG